MSDTARSRGIARAVALSTSREALLTATVLLAQIVAVLAYLGVTGTQVLSLRETLYPVAWITISVYFVAYLWRYGPDIRSSTVALAAGVGYFLLLALLSGIVWPGHQLLGHGMGGADVTVFWRSPGWGPTASYSSSIVQGTIIPFKLVAYSALAYGIAAAVAASSRGALAGFVGMFSCVGCMLPIIGAVAGLFGGSGAVASTINGNYDIGTAVFAITVLVLLVTIPTADPFADRR